MRRLAMLGGVVVALVCLSGVFVVAAPGGGAVVIKEFGCSLPAWASGGPVNLWTNDKTHDVLTPSGNIKLTCHFKFDPVAAGGPAKAIKAGGYLCNTHWGLTTNSQSIVTPGGTALLVCMIKPSPNP